MRLVIAALFSLLLSLGAATPAVSQSNAEITFWNSVKDSSDPADLKAYLRAYPAGRWAPQAHIKLDHLARSAGRRSGSPGERSTAGPVAECDKLAAHPHDPARKGEGVAFDWLMGKEALAACRAAVRTRPEEPRLRYQLGRALEKTGATAEAYEQTLSAANKGHVAAMIRTGFGHLRGSSIDRHVPTAIRWFERAADHGSAHAMVLLGLLYLEGKEVQRDLGRAVAWHRKAAANGESQAMYNLGFMYLNGNGVRKSPARGIEWLSKSAEYGYANAALELAQMYEQGSIVQRDFKKSLKWYLKAAEYDAPFASYRLFELYRQGSRVNLDERAAASFLMQAIEDGYVIQPEQLSANARTWSITFQLALQEALRREGFYDGAIDGRFGPQTRRAIEALSEAGYVDTDRPALNDRANKPLQVNIPELNVFTRPSSNSNRLGSVVSGDQVTAHRWTTDYEGNRWARICNHRFCGWSAADFLIVPLPQTEKSSPVQTTAPKPVTTPVAPKVPAVDSSPKPEEGLGSLD